MVSYQSYPAPLFSLCLRAFVCVLCTLMDQCTAEENDLRTPPVLLSFFPSVSLCVCVLILLTAPDGTWAQPMEMTGREYFLCRRLSFFFFFCNPVFHAFVDIWLAHRSNYQGTSIDHVKHVDEACFVFGPSVDAADRESHGLSLWDLLIDKVKFLFVELKGWTHLTLLSPGTCVSDISEYRVPVRCKCLNRKLWASLVGSDWDHC